jgi:NarL family two-component system response regulator LiaR
MGTPKTQPEDKIRVLIVDDHAVVRQGLRTFLDLQGDVAWLPIEVVGEAANGVEAVELARQLQPDIVLLDLVMPEMDGIAATSRIIQNCPQTQVIILTSFGEQDRVIPAIRAGAQSYLLKDIPPDDLVQAVRQAYRGQVQLHPEVAKSLMTAIAEDESASVGQVAKPALSDLTERELEVLLLIANGLSNNKIAKKLIISEKTVKSHVSSILSKLHLEDRTQAAIYALKHNLDSDEP